MMFRHLLSTSRTSRRCSTTPFLRYRVLSQKPGPPSKEQVDAAAIQDTISGHAAVAVNFAKRFVKFSLIGAVLIAAGYVSACEGAHFYVEHQSLAPETDEEIKRYQWDLTADRWQGNANAGGTDPGLGWSGRHSVRAAWMARNWGIGREHTPQSSGSFFASPEKVSRTNAYTPESVELWAALEYLHTALTIAQVKSSHLHPFTFPELLTRFATILERLGNDYLSDVKKQFKLAWDAYSGQGLNGARVALKLGDISFRLDEKAEALDWWKRAVQLSQGQPPAELEDSNLLPLPTQVPESPWAQRILASTLVSISAFYAKSGKLREAETFEKSALTFLRSVPQPESLATASPPQALHALYLLHRSSLLSIHLAEVLHAEKQSTVSSIQWLTSAAESSERVARALSGLPLHPPSGVFQEGSVTNDSNQLLPVYASSRSMSEAAGGLYRDARRTAAETWNLLGMLYESKGGLESKMAHDCFARAVQWAGERSEQGGLQANEGTTQADWNVIWNNFKRTRPDEK